MQCAVRYLVIICLVLATCQVATANSDLIAGTQVGGYIFNSSNGGFNWSRVQRLDIQQNIHSLANLGGGVLLAGTYPDAKIYRSTSDGGNWSLAAELGDEDRVYAMLPLDNGEVIAGTWANATIHRSTDNGLTWTCMTTLAPETAVLSFVNMGNGQLLAGTLPNGTIWNSTDYGHTWSYVLTLNESVETVGVYGLAYLGNGQLIASGYNASTTTGGFIYNSTDYGRSWSVVRGMLPSYGFTRLMYTGNGNLSAGSAAQSLGAKVWNSTDGGLTWLTSPTIPGESFVYGLLNMGNGVMFLGTRTGGEIWNSSDYGASWGFVQDLGMNGVYVFLDTADKPVPNFSSNVTSVPIGALVQFNDTTSYDRGKVPVYWNWSFGDNQFSESQNATHSYSSGGVYTVGLTVITTTNSNTTSRVGYMDVQTDNPIVQWTLSKSTVRVPGNVTVNDTSITSPTAWSYYWGDGTANSTFKNGTHKFVKRGVFHLTLNVTNASGSNVSASKQVRVVGYDPVQGVYPDIPLWDRIIEVASDFWWILYEWFTCLTEGGCW